MHNFLSRRKKNTPKRRKKNFKWQTFSNKRNNLCREVIILQHESLKIDGIDAKREITRRHRCVRWRTTKKLLKIFSGFFSASLFISCFSLRRVKKTYFLFNRCASEKCCVAQLFNSCFSLSAKAARFDWFVGIEPLFPCWILMIPSRKKSMYTEWLVAHIERAISIVQFVILIGFHRNIED